MAVYADKKDGKLTGRWRVEVQVDGKRKRGRFDTLAEARKTDEAWRQAFPLEDAKERQDKRGVPTTLRDLVAKTEGHLWRGKKSRDLAEGRLARLVQFLGADIKLTDLTTPELDRIVAQLLKKKLKPITINKYLSALHKLLKWGQDRRWFGPMPVFPWLDEEGEGRIRWITPAEECALLSLVSPEVAAVIRVAIQTGMRRGEILSLEKHQVDREWVHIWTTKTKKTRSVPISRDTYYDLQWLLQARMPTLHILRYQWEKARNLMGLVGDEWFSFHVCRHTCATRLVLANVNIRIIQKWLGHKRIETTLRYAQVSDEALRQAKFAQEVFRSGVLDSPPRVGYEEESGGMLPDHDNLHAIKPAQIRFLDRSRVAKSTKKVAGVAKLADAQDLGSCGDHNNPNILNNLSPPVEGE